MSGAHTAGRREIAPDARKRPSVPSAGARQDNHTPGAGNAPGAVVDGNPAKTPIRPEKRTPRHILKRAHQAAKGIEAAGALLAAAVSKMRKVRRECAAGRMTRDERDAEWMRQWREIHLTLDDHADALTVFIGEFLLAGCFRFIAEAERKLEADAARAAAKRR